LCWRITVGGLFTSMYMIVVNENHLRRILKSYCQYYHRTRTHLALSKDAPEPRAKQSPDMGAVIEIAEVGGLAPVRAPGSLMKSLKMQSRRTVGEPHGIIERLVLRSI